MNKPGFVLYKCRRCGKISKHTHAPDALPTLLHILYDTPLPTKWGNGIPVDKYDICNCDDGNLGVCDVIGFEVDKKEGKEIDCDHVNCIDATQYDDACRCRKRYICHDCGAVIFK